MPSRSFPEVPQLVQPAYKDMGAELAGAHVAWARMQTRPAASVFQMPAAWTVPAEPYFQPVAIQRRPESRGDAVLIGMLIAAIIELIISSWQLRPAQR